MVGRFQVMALLQAARAQALGYPLDEAESFGLNRAIFYAAAKRGFKGGTGSKHAGEKHVLRETPGRSTTKKVQQDALGDEVAYYVEMDGEKRYVMGDEIQEPGDFRRQVAERFGQAFPQACEQAVQIVGQTDRATLESRRKFYSERQPPHVGSPQEHGFRTEGNSLDGVRTAPDTAVEEQGDSAIDCRCDIGERIQ